MDPAGECTRTVDFLRNLVGHAVSFLFDA